MANTYLEGLFNRGGDSPSRIVITMPGKSKVSDLANIQLIGLMNGEPNFSAGNKWGPIIGDLSNLQDFSSLIGSGDTWTWIGASTMCWKGTDPLSTSVEFFLINYHPNMDLKTQLKKLTKFAALGPSSKAVAAKTARATVHGGYAADVLDSNKSFFSTKVNDLASLSKSSLAKVGDDLYVGGYATGALQVQFGRKLLLKNLLLTKLNVSTSTIEVADSSGGNVKPLFYKVSAQFTGVRPLLTTDVDSMFDL